MAQQQSTVTAIHTGGRENLNPPQVYPCFLDTTTPFLSDGWPRHLKRFDGLFQRASISQANGEYAKGFTDDHFVSSKFQIGPAA
jgi:hypothetical protein